MNPREERFWYLVREAAAEYSGVGPAAFTLWSTSDQGDIPVNQYGYPVGGMSLRDTGAELAKRGFVNKHGRPYAAESVDDLINNTVPLLVAKVLKVEPTDETLEAIKENFIEVRRQKRRYSQGTQEDIERQRWRSKVRRKRKRVWETLDDPEDYAA